MSDKAAGKSKGKKQIDFIVTTSDPNDDQSNAANKKRVRSVAALKSWPERRKKLFEQLESSGSGQGAFLVEDASSRPKSKSKSPVRPVQFIQQTPPPASNLSSTAAAPSRAKRPKTYGPSPPTAAQQPVPYASALNPGAQVFVPTTTSSGKDLSTQVATTLEKRSSLVGSSIEVHHRASTRLLVAQDAEHHISGPSAPCQCQQCRIEQRMDDTPLGAVSSCETHGAVVPVRRKRMADGSDKPLEFTGDMAMITPPSSPGAGPLTGKMEPFNLYPVEYKPWFDLILHHMMTVYAPRGWPALKISDDQGVKWEWFMTQNSLSEPALFYVRLLFGSGDMIRLGSLRKDIMYWLRQEAIKAINDALRDPKRSCSDALILAVGRIALHEHMYGDKFASSHVHRPAQKRMIEMRGGMKSLEFPELVKRLMRWSDRIMAVGSGSPRMLEDDETTPSFTLKQSVGAIERWAPQEMPGVRSKIRISDLVNDEDET